MLTSDEEVSNRWKEHFSTILNRPPPNETAEVCLDNIDTLEVDCNPIRASEIVDALKELKANKSPGIDEITAELLKADANMTARHLTPLFRNIWDTEEVPADWKRGIIVKLPKKGDLTQCGNWRGLTLMSILGKVFSKTILNRLRMEVDKKLRKEQAGFRKGRGTTEQIFILRNIIEQSIEWNNGLYCIFVDFEKAFDSVNRTVLWNILKSYGIPEKFINLIKAFYDNCEAAVRHNGKLSEWFEILSGLKQGCVLSGFLFLLVIDWVMRKTLEGGRYGIRWTITEQLDDLDYANDISLLSEAWKAAQEKLNAMNKYSLQAGFEINTKKTESI